MRFFRDEGSIQAAHILGWFGMCGPPAVLPHLQQRAPCQLTDWTIEFHAVRNPSWQYRVAADRGRDSNMPAMLWGMPSAMGLAEEWLTLVP